MEKPYVLSCRTCRPGSADPAVGGRGGGRCRRVSCGAGGLDTAAPSIRRWAAEAAQPQGRAEGGARGVLLERCGGLRGSAGVCGPCIYCRTKDEKLECLKWSGSSFCAN